MEEPGSWTGPAPAHESAPGDPEPATPAPAQQPLRWRLPLLLFLATVASTMYAGRGGTGDPEAGWLDGWKFAVPLLAILLAHEFGHYTFARLRGVRVSLPFFIPMPFSFIGTMGAVIRMEAARSRNALLDVGASGPLAGLAVALPVLAIGLKLSTVAPLFHPGQGGIQEGQSLLYWAMKRVFVGELGPEQDVLLHPTALAGWVGLLVTMINLMPIGQLDGGHVAYALLGAKQDRYSNLAHALLPVVAVACGLYSGWQALAHGWSQDAAIQDATNAGMPWLFWAIVLLVMRRFAGKKHPPVLPGEALTPGRKVVAVFTLGLFAALFMPAWILLR